MNKRTFTPNEINRLLNSLAGDDPYDLGGGLVATRMAAKDKIIFQITRDGKGEHFLKDADAAELAAISAALWEKGKEFIPDDTADLIPDELKDEVDTAEGLDALVPKALREEKDPLEGTVEGLTPFDLREKPDDPTLEKDELGLTPDALRDIIKDPALARRLATGTATVSDLLTPESLKGGE